MHLYMIELKVADFARSLAWYRDQLGLAVELLDEPNQFALLNTGAGKLALKAGEPRPGTETLAFRVDDLDRTLSDLAAHGLRPDQPPRSDPEGYRTALFLDPDGYRVRVLAMPSGADDALAWPTCGDPLRMLEMLRRADARKLRLFAAACSRRMWDAIDDFGRAAIQVAEAFADGTAGENELRAARLACKSAGESAAWYAAASNPAVAARNAALSAQSANPGDAERVAQAALLRDIFGNPFRPVVVEERWRTPAVVELARTIYESDPRQAGGHVRLAEALAAAGCDCAAILEHCRGDGPHVRGCWVLDMILGKL
jgi:catechol 2,3-dioxygenase-like lactoylglutathione lyase family enzyme